VNIFCGFPVFDFLRFAYKRVKKNLVKFWYEFWYKIRAGKIRADEFLLSEEQRKKWNATEKGKVEEKGETCTKLLNKNSPVQRKFLHPEELENRPTDDKIYKTNINPE
jgi:hypothetical protein